MNLLTWVDADLQSLAMRIERGVLDVIPADRRAERVDGGGIAPTYILWHTARHHDVAVNAALRQRDEVVEGWTSRIGVDRDLWRGLAEGEDAELVTELDPEAVGQYLLATIAATRTWLDEADPTALDGTPDSAGALGRVGAPEDRFDWLYSMWLDKPAPFFLQWQAVGHGYTHLGELISIRNRMGLSPF